MENQIFYIQYSDSHPFKIETHFIVELERRSPLVDVTDLIDAIKQAVSPLFNSVSIIDLSVHLPENITRKDSKLTDDCFLKVDEMDTTFHPTCLLKDLWNVNTQRTPFIIKDSQVNILECPLYQLSFNSVTREASTDSHYLFKPETVTRWDDFEALVNSCRSPVYARQYQPLPHTVIGTEESMYPHFFRLFLWAKDAILASGELVLSDHTQADVHGQPDFFFVNGRVVYLTIEVTRPFNLPPAVGDLVEAFSDQIQTNPCSELVRAVCQEYGYMVNNGNQYGVLSTWEGTWFMKRGTDASSTLYISNCVKYNSTRISFFKALACIADLARHSPRFVSASPLQTVLSQGTHLSSFSDLYRDVAPLQDLAQNTGPLHTIDASPNQTTPPHVSITISSAESLTHLARLLNQKPFTQGRPLCDILGRVLGYGRCCSVYECVIGSVLSAVKSIDPMKKRLGKSSHHAILRECNAYDALSELQSAAIPRLIISTSYYNGMMLMATELGSEGVCKVMDEGRKNLALCSLRMIHAKGYIHGDIRKENVVFHLSNGVYKALWVDLETCRLGMKTEFDAEIRAVLTF